jgi:transposase-like protein
MAKKTALLQIRVFSEELRKEIVKQIERGEIGVREAQRAYNIGSSQTLYNWLHKYSINLKKGTRLVMEKDSQEKSNQELKRKIKELEAALGRKSLEADLYNEMLVLASKELKIDLKKNFGDKASPPSEE